MPYYVGTFDAQGVEQASRVLGGVRERVPPLTTWAVQPRPANSSRGSASPPQVQV